MKIHCLLRVESSLDAQRGRHKKNRLVERARPDGTFAAWTYDPAGNLTKKTDRLGRVTEYAYDALDRLTTETWLDEFDDPVETITSSFDAQGDFSGAANSAAVYTFLRDDLGRVIAENHTLTTTGLSPLGVGLHRAWNSLGEQEQLYVDLDGFFTLGPQDFTNLYTHDLRGRVTSIWQHGGLWTGSGWAGAGGTDVIEKFVALDWLDDGQLDTITRKTAPGGATVAVTDYVYDVTVHAPG